MAIRGLSYNVPNSDCNAIQRDYSAFFDRCYKRYEAGEITLAHWKELMGEYLLSWCFRANAHADSHRKGIAEDIQDDEVWAAQLPGKDGLRRYWKRMEALAHDEDESDEG